MKWLKNLIRKFIFNILLSEVGATNYPAALDGFVVKTAGQIIAESHVNNVQDSIEALEAKLGIDSSAVVTSFDYFLKHASGAYRSHKHDGTSDDGAKLDWDDIWLDAVHNHSSAGEGGTSLSGISLAAITTLTAANNLDIGAYELRALTFESDIATGTPPFTIASETVVSNLNVDQVDGVDLPGTLASVISDLPATIATLLSDHDKAAHDALNINADTLDTAHASATPSNGIIVIADASGFLHTPSAAPDADYEVSNKKYVDDNTVGTGDVSQTYLKTSSAEVSHQLSAAGNYTLSGGEYGFYPQTKVSAANSGVYQAQIMGGNGAFNGYTSYVTNITLSSDGTRFVYAQQRYVTASGEDHWIFLLVDKVTKNIISSYQAPDHPCYGQGGNEIEIPHPFGSYDPSKHEIVIVDNSILTDLKPKITRKKSMLTLINEDCLIDDTKRPNYQPREIIEIDEIGDMEGELIKTIKTPDWAKIKLKNDHVELKKRMVETLPENILYKKLKLK